LPNTKSTLRHRHGRRGYRGYCAPLHFLRQSHQLASHVLAHDRWPYQGRHPETRRDAGLINQERRIVLTLDAPLAPLVLETAADCL